jgi:hypothetical protein
MLHLCNAKLSHVGLLILPCMDSDPAFWGCFRYYFLPQAQRAGIVQSVQWLDSGEIGITFRVTVEIFLGSSSSPGRIQSPNQLVPQALSLRVKQPDREAEHSPEPNTEVKNAWNYTFAPLYLFITGPLLPLPPPKYVLNSPSFVLQNVYNYWSLAFVDMSSFWMIHRLFHLVCLTCWVLVDAKWCTALRITWFFYFVHRPILWKLENTTFRKLDLFPSPDEGGDTPTLLGPIERTNSDTGQPMSVIRVRVT